MVGGGLGASDEMGQDSVYRLTMHVLLLLLCGRGVMIGGGVPCAGRWCPASVCVVLWCGQLWYVMQ